MASLLTVLASVSVFLWFPVAAVEALPPPTASQGVEDSLRALKMKWESNFDLHLNTNVIACGNLVGNYSAGCRELELNGNSRAYVYSAENGMYYCENVMRKASLCTTHSFFENIASNLTSSLPVSRPLQLSIMDAYGAYKATLLPEAGIGNAQENGGSAEDEILCNNGEFNAETFDPRRAMTYIRTISSPKFVTFLNLVRPSGVHALPALRTLQYLLTYTLTPDRDFLALLPPFQSQLSDEDDASRTGNETSPGSAQAGNRTFSAAEAGSGASTTPNSQFGKIFMASESNIAALNNSLELESVEQVDLEHLMSVLTEQKTANVTIPCTRVLIAIIEEDIGTDLANTLLTLPESNPVLQVLFIDVSRRRSMGRESMDFLYPNVKRVYCESTASFEESTIDVDQIARRAESLQSYLNYLSWPGIAATYVMY